MTVIKVEPGREPYVTEIGDDLPSLQREVDGYIEAYYPFADNDVCIICNEEGKINGMEPNRGILDDNGELVDIVCGPFLIVGYDSFDFTSIPAAKIDRFLQMFHYPELFVIKRNGVNSSIKCIKFDPYSAMTIEMDDFH